MVTVEGSVKFPIKKRNDAAADTDCRAEHVDDKEDLILRHASPGDEHVIFDHRSVLKIIGPGVDVLVACQC
jgi:hypothetical protein